MGARPYNDPTCPHGLAVRTPAFSRRRSPVRFRLGVSTNRLYLRAIWLVTELGGVRARDLWKLFGSLPSNACCVRRWRSGRRRRWRGGVRDEQVVDQIAARAQGPAVSSWVLPLKFEYLMCAITRILGNRDLRFGDGLDGRRQIGGGATVSIGTSGA